MRRFVRDQTVSPDWKCPLYRGVPKERFRCSKTNLNQGILNGTGLIFWNFEVPGVQIRRMITNLWVISEKISCRLISSEKEFLQRNGFVYHGKNYIAKSLGEKKNYYTNQTAHTYPPASKVKWPAPNLCGYEIRHQFPRRYWTPRKWICWSTPLLPYWIVT